jgi:signal transduction histidine kinase
MISLIPKAESFSGRALNSLGKVLGLRSETVYSRAILLLALFQFIVLGLAVVLVWLSVTDKFAAAEKRDLFAAAERVRSYLELRRGSPPPSLVPAAATLTGRRVEWRVPAAGLPGPGIHLGVADGRPVAAFAVPDASGRALGEITVAGSGPFFEAGELAVRIFVVGLALAGGLMLLIMLLVVDRTIVGRIQLLADKVEHEKDSERLPVKLNYPGDDELAMLARSIEELAVLVQDAEREYRHVVEDQTESICRFDRDWCITYSNRAFEDLCALPPIGRKPALEACLAPEIYRTLQETVRALSPEKTTTVFTQQVTKPGSPTLWYRCTLRANFDAGGSLVSGQWIAADITSEVTAQRRLQDSQKQLANLSARLMTLQDEERRRLARELHDSTAQSLAALEINMSALEKTGDPAEAKRLAAESGEISRQVVDELRTISYLLHPPLLEEAGLVFALRWLADGFTKRNSIPVVVDVPEDFPRLSPELETALFRIVQESLSNIYRHAGAAKAWITMARSEAGEISLEIRDNGKGLPDDFSLARSSGVGLAGMRERMRELGGTLEVESSEFGVAVKCRLKRSDVSRA